MKMSSIVAATNLTEASDQVVRAAGEIAAASGAALHVLHAFDLPSEGEAELPAGVRATFEGRMAEAEERLARQIARTVPEGVRVEGRRVEMFVPHRAITDFADSVGADLIVVGPHSRRGVADELLGGTADRVIRSATVPCLVVRGPLRMPLRTLLAPVDGSGAADVALQVALEWAGALGGRGAERPRVTALHVLPRSLHLPALDIDADQIRDGFAAKAAGALGASGYQGAVEVETAVRWGESASEEVVARAREGGVDLIVLGTHGRGLIQRFLIGSVASGVAQRAPCPVLLVPPAMWAEER